ncbi:MAG: SDR family NAD(P)-dependent oxidoreductase [Raoultibacter sp.]
MDKKIILVTGATDGVGKAAAKALAEQSHKVIIHGRNEAKAKAVIEELEAQNALADFEYIIADLLSFKAIQSMAQEFVKRFDHLDVLINNAGAVFSNERVLTVDGEEQTFQLNVFAPFLLTYLLLPSLQKSDSSRVVIEASAAHGAARKPDFSDMRSDKVYAAQSNYSLSKLYAIWMGQHFARYLLENSINNVTVNITHPGTVASSFGQGTKKGFVNDLIYNVVGPIIATSPEEGAKSEVFLATSPSVEGVSGKYYSNKCEEDKPNQKYYSAENEKKLWDYCMKVCDPFL